MELSYLIVFSVILWAWLTTRVQESTLKKIMVWQNIFYALTIALLPYFSHNYTLGVALDIWFYVVILQFSVFLTMFGILFITGSLEKERFEDGF